MLNLTYLQSIALNAPCKIFSFYKINFLGMLPILKTWLLHNQRALLRLNRFIFLQDKEGLALHYDASHSGGLNSSGYGHHKR